jgi:hypothetical protein
VLTQQQQLEHSSDTLAAISGSAVEIYGVIFYQASNRISSIAQILKVEKDVVCLAFGKLRDLAKMPYGYHP